jgi:hypothetical protein
VGREGLLVNDVDDTISNEDVRSNNASSVDEVCAVLNSDGQILAESGLKSGAILKRAGVPRCTAIDNVVRKDVLQVLLGQTFKCSVHGSQRCVVRCEDREVGCVLDGVDQAGCVDGSAEGGQACSRGCVEDADGESKNLVNDVDHAAGEVQVLETGLAFGLLVEG